MAKKPKSNNAQTKAIKRLKARGFAVIDNEAGGVTLGLVDGEGFFQKVLVTRQGQIRRYKSIRAREFHKQRLPHIKGTLKVLSNGNFV